MIKHLSEPRFVRIVEYMLSAFTSIECTGIFEILESPHTDWISRENAHYTLIWNADHTAVAGYIRNDILVVPA